MKERYDDCQDYSCIRSCMVYPETACISVQNPFSKIQKKEFFTIILVISFISLYITPSDLRSEFTSYDVTIIERKLKGWRDSSAIKTHFRLFRRSEFSSQYPHADIPLGESEALF